MAELLTIALSANETKTFRKGGSYVEIISSTYPVGLSLYSANGSQIDSLNGAQSGFFLGCNFGAFSIQNGAAAQVIQLLALDAGEIGGTRRQPGNVRVIDEITDAITSVTVNQGTGIASFAATILIPPSANLNGMIIRMASVVCTAGAGGTASTRVMAGKASPTGYFVPPQCFQLVELFTSSTTEVNATSRFNKLLPPGWGLYHEWQVITSTPVVGPGCVVQYEML